MDIEKIKAAILFTVTLLNLFAAYLVWRRGKGKDTFYLGWCFFFSAVYCFSWVGVYFFETNKLLWTRAHWIGGGLMGTYYLLFVYYFTGRTRYIGLKIFIWSLLGYSIAFLSLTTPYFFTSVSPNYPYLTRDSLGVLNIPVGRIFTILVSVFTLYYLIKGYQRTSGFKKWQIKYFIWGMSLSTLIAFAISGVWPLLAPDYNPAIIEILAYGTIILVGFTVYAIFKNKLFNIKVILTELLVEIIGLILLVQIFFIAEIQAKIISLVIFLLFLISGYLLIKSTNKEIEREEQARSLAKQLSELNLNLEKKVEEKTAELRAKIKELGEAKTALINILEDNTEATKVMEEEKNKTLAIIANFIDPIIVLDKDHKISMINPSASKNLGLSVADLGQPVATDHNFSVANFQPFIKKDFEIKRIDEGAKGQLFPAEEITLKEKVAGGTAPGATYKIITAQVLSSKNELLGSMKIFYDTTREKAIDRLKSEFISVAAHQLRTPLSAIKWVVKMLLDGDVGPLTVEQQELLGKGYRSNERIIRLVNDLLNVSRIEEGKFGFNFEASDFQEVLNAALGSIEALVAKNRQILIVKKPKQLPKVYLDKERMIMVMQNLLDNAIKYTPEYGQITIEVKVDSQRLHVKIKDQGVGIPLKDQPKLFSKFFRAANAVRLETEGTGLGLFIVKNIIERHHGQISLNSQEGQGTEVSFFIPLNQ